MLTISTAASCRRFTLLELWDFFKNDLVIISVTGMAINYFTYKDSVSRNSLCKKAFYTVTKNSAWSVFLIQNILMLLVIFLWWNFLHILLTFIQFVLLYCSFCSSVQSAYYKNVYFDPVNLIFSIVFKNRNYYGCANEKKAIKQWPNVRKKRCKKICIFFNHHSWRQMHSFSLPETIAYSEQLLLVN